MYLTVDLCHNYLCLSKHNSSMFECSSYQANYRKFSWNGHRWVIAVAICTLQSPIGRGCQCWDHRAHRATGIVPVVRSHSCWHQGLYVFPPLSHQGPDWMSSSLTRWIVAIVVLRAHHSGHLLQRFYERN